MNWAQKFVVDELRLHRDLNPDGEVVAAVTPAGEKRFGPAIASAGLGPSVRIMPVTDAGNHDHGRTAVICVVGGNQADARSAYAAFGRAKALGVPVVFCVPERKILRTAPGWQNSGIMYEGMYFLAAQYASTLRPTGGAYCEFGVFDGRTFVMAAHALKNVCGTFHAFDSYKGIGGSLAEETTHYHDGDYSANVQTLHYNMRSAGVGAVPYQVIPGYFQDSLKGRTCRDDGIEHVAIAHIDVDVYEPAKLALDYLTPGLLDGALLMFDDFDQLAARDDLGERRALREWLAENPQITVELYRTYGVFCRAFIVHRNDR